MNDFFRIAWTLLFCLGGCATAFAQQDLKKQEPAPSVANARIGIGGYARRGHEAVFRAELTLPQAPMPERVSLHTTDGDGAPVEFTARVNARESLRKTPSIAIPFRVGPPRSPYVLKLSDQSQTTFTETSLGKIAASTSELIGTVGPAIGLEAGLKTLERSSDDAIIIPLSRSDLDDLALNPTGLDMLVISGNEKWLTQDPAAVKIVRDWVYGGGRLVVTVGEHAATLFGENSLLARFLPGKYLASDRMESVTGLQAFSGSELKFEGEAPPMAKVEIPKKLAVLFESGSAADDRPLAAENMFGFGRITWIFFDLNDRRFESWNGKGRFLARLLSGQEGKFGEEENTVRGGQASHLGYRDLAGQLRGALDQYAGVSPIHFYPVMGLLLLYLLLIGPGEYFFLRRFAPGAMHLTWFLSPLLICAAAYGFTAIGNAVRGPEAIVNEAMICDVHSETGAARGWIWAGVYSPRAAVVSLNGGENRFQNVRTQWSWQALPGEGLGGVDTPAIGLTPRAPYQVEQGDQSETNGVSRVPVAQAGSKLFSGSFHSEISPAFELAGEPSRLRTGKISDLQGSFRNVLPVRLKNAFLAYGTNMYRAYDDIAPGETIGIDRLKPKHLEYQLTRREVSNNSDFNQPWNEEATEIPRILEMMMFHRAVGGASYTVLTNKFEPRIDLSFAPAHGYALLVGSSEEHPIESNYAVGGRTLDSARTKRHTVYRVLYRVEIGGASDVNTKGKGPS